MTEILFGVLAYLIIGVVVGVIDSFVDGKSTGDSLWEVMKFHDITDWLFLMIGWPFYLAVIFIRRYG
jgi:hypothetical protein